jgi:TRAP-type C4-dicarboxylate transport system permease small subunit
LKRRDWNVKLIAALGRWIERVETAFGNVLIAIMSISIFFEVISRYVFGSSHSLLEEFNPLMLVWLTFLTVGILTKRDRHVRMDLIRGKVSEKGKNVLDLIGYAAEMVLIGFIGVTGVLEVKLLYELGTVSATDVAYPMFVAALCVPIGCAFILVHVLEEFIKTYMSLQSAKEVV